MIQKSNKNLLEVLCLLNDYYTNELNKATSRKDCAWINYFTGCCGTVNNLCSIMFNATIDEAKKEEVISVHEINKRVDKLLKTSNKL